MSPIALRSTVAVFVLAASVASASVPNTSQLAQPGTCSAAHRAQMHQLAATYFDIVGRQQYARFGEVFSDDLLLVSTVGTFVGLDAYKALMAQVFAGMPDIQWTIDSVHVDGSDLIIRYHYQATNTGSFGGKPPTNNAFTCTGMEINRVVNGRIVESINFSDALCLLGNTGGL